VPSLPPPPLPPPGDVFPKRNRTFGRERERVRETERNGTFDKELADELELGRRY
jgi:hypothetical protein